MSGTLALKRPNSLDSDPTGLKVFVQVEEFEFELNEVYSIDVVMSTGEGLVKVS